jgi:DNA repair exonuclease SbcCD ATPase subunit
MTDLLTPAPLASLTERLRRSRRALDRQAGEAQALARQGRTLTEQIDRLEAEIEHFTRAAAVLTSIGEARQAKAQATIEALVTKGLHAIFGTDLSFHLQPVVRGNRPEVDFVVRSTLDDGTTVDTPVMDARGGGLAAVIGTLLRLVVLLLSRDRQAPVLFLDETFAHLSADYEPRMAEFLRNLVDQTPDVQVVLVTHSDAFTDLADAVYRFTLTGGVTQVAKM